MNTALLEKKIAQLAKQVAALKTPKKISSKLAVDDATLKAANKAPFDFDIDTFVTRKDLTRPWKK